MPNNNIPQKRIEDLSTSLSAKQDTLTAGDNISISGSTISATIPYATSTTIGGIKISIDSNNVVTIDLGD